MKIQKMLVGVLFLLAACSSDNNTIEVQEEIEEEVIEILDTPENYRLVSSVHYSQGKFISQSNYEYDKENNFRFKQRASYVKLDDIAPYYKWDYYYNAQGRLDSLIATNVFYNYRLSAEYYFYEEERMVHSVLIEKIDFKGAVHKEFEYNDLGQKIIERVYYEDSPDDITTTEFLYDVNGNNTTRTVSNGLVFNFEFDTMNNIRLAINSSEVWSAYYSNPNNTVYNNYTNEYCCNEFTYNEYGYPIEELILNEDGVIGDSFTYEYEILD